MRFIDLETLRNMDEVDLLALDANTVVVDFRFAVPQEYSLPDALRLFVTSFYVKYRLLY